MARRLGYSAQWCEVFQEYTCLPDDSAALLSYFVFTTWFLDLLPTAPAFP